MCDDIKEWKSLPISGLWDEIILQKITIYPIQILIILIMQKLLSIFFHYIYDGYGKI